MCIVTPLLVKLTTPIKDKQGHWVRVAMFPEGMSTVVHAGQGPRNKAKVRAKIIIPNKASCCC